MVHRAVLNPRARLRPQVIYTEYDHRAKRQPHDVIVDQDVGLVLHDFSNISGVHDPKSSE